MSPADRGLPGPIRRGSQLGSVPITRRSEQACGRRTICNWALGSELQPDDTPELRQAASWPSRAPQQDEGDTRVPTTPPCSYLVHQVLLGNLDRVLLGPKAVALICHLLGHQLLQDEQQQLIVVPAERQVAGECLRRQQVSLQQGLRPRLPALCPTHAAQAPPPQPGAPASRAPCPIPRRPGPPSACHA